MGVAGTVGFFKRHSHNWNRRIVMRDTKVVIDVTKGFYWAVKEQLIEKYGSSGYEMDQYGTSMIELGQYCRDLLRGLQRRNCTPILVFEGCRLDEARYGALASKGQFMRRSSEAALRRLERGLVSSLGDLPELATNCIKEIANECGLAPDQVHQATYEVYPVLEQLARQHQCPVMTSHSDFIFSDVPAGFIWLEEVALPSDAQVPWLCSVYHHRDMMSQFGLAERYSEAVNCIRTLMRDDFRDTYSDAVNSILNLGSQRHGQKTRQLCNLMERWPHNLDSVGAIRDELRNRRWDHYVKLIQDFACIHATFTQADEFSTSDLVRRLAAGRDQLGNVQDALTRRESSADFLGNLRYKSVDYRRTNFQDIQTFRSTFSLCDRAKQYLAERLQVIDARLFDRERDSMVERPVSGANQISGPLQASLTRDILFKLFHFDEASRDALAQTLSNLYQIDGENSNHLALMLLLARYSIKLVPRENYDNTDRNRQQTGTSSPSGRSRSRSSSRGRTSSPSSGGGGNNPMAQRYHNADMRRKYFTAILNSFIYHLGRQHQGDQSSREVPADIRVARQKIESIASRPPSCSASSSKVEYVTCKHLVEALNSTLHGYKELNSLYNFPGPNLLVNKYYDGVLTYKLMSGMSNTLAGFLLQLEAELERELFDF